MGTPGDAARPAAAGGVTATFRFYEELNDFLPPARRRRDFSVACARAATTKHMVEALGVPHTEVELILLNGESVGFDRILADGDRVAVYPVFESFDVTPLLRLRERPLRSSRFVADAHLGGLAHLLRMLGFDTLYDNAFADAEIERLAATEHRIALTRDRELLKRRGVTHGMYVRALRSVDQLREVAGRLDLARSARPFSRCLHCNGALVAAAKADVLPRLPPRAAATFERFSVCRDCGRVFWEGSHWRRMKGLVEEILAGAAPASAPPSAGDAQERR